jgi:predicted TIM-barrel fold metal-dependent hydrolase
MREAGLIVLMHAGFDIAYPRDRVADPARIAAVARRIPGLRLVAAHLGGWEDWDEVRRHLLGLPVWLDVSFSLHCMSREAARALILEHRPGYVLFGSDSPWFDQAGTIALIEGLGLDDAARTGILYDNARRLLDAAHA